MKAPRHVQEEERLDAVHKLHILDTETDPLYDALTIEATQKLDVPISTVSILDKNREWYKSCQGLPMREGERDVAFCSWALLSKNIFIIEDTLEDDRFKDNVYVVGPPYIRFYAGFALMDKDSRLPVGVFCVKDTKPRKLSVDEVGILFDLAKKAEALLNTHSDKV
jgi:GAF domain-containing protein